MECGICTEKGVDIETSCGHGLHAKCLKLWSKRKSSCPECHGHLGQKVKYIC